MTSAGARAIRVSAQALLVASALASPLAHARDDRSPKLTVRVSNGMLSNDGTAGGGDLSLGGFNLVYTHFITDRFTIGLGYRAEFDFANGLLPLSGFELPVRYYLSRRGTQTMRETPEITSGYRSIFAYYLGAQLLRQDFFVEKLTEDGTTSNETGNYSNLGALIGMDYSLSRNLELNAEADLGIFAFASSDPAYRFRSLLLKVGISFVF